MNKIASFTVDHLRLMSGVYVSRVDGDVVTYDIRVTRPNAEAVMSTTECHTIEHLGATFLRNNSVYGDKVVYFGPMGCRTGFYLLLFAKAEAAEVAKLVREMFEWIAAYEGEIPGAAAKDCGNYTDLELSSSKARAQEFLGRSWETCYPS